MLSIGNLEFIFTFFLKKIYRCDLIINANGKTEKITSGLLNPFLAHLKTAQDQIAQGGYSIRLEPETGNDATWFTKGTIERYVLPIGNPHVTCSFTICNNSICIQIPEVDKIFLYANEDSSARL